MQALPKPWLLYAYPWQPFPRRLVIYLRERNISSSLVTVVPVSDVPFGDKAADGFPPRPAGSLPILAIPQPQNEQAPDFIYIKQSVAIMEFLDQACLSGRWGFPKLYKAPALPISAPFEDDDADAIHRARHNELLSLANGLTDSWNPVRTFGSGAGTMRIPEAAREMLGWTRRTVLAVEKWFEDNEYSFAGLKWGDEERRELTIAEIVLFQFFDFTKDCYGVDMTKSSGKKVIDVYGREVLPAYPNLVKFYQLFMTRPGARRDLEDGDVPHESWVKNMTDWSDGVFDVVDK